MRLSPGTPIGDTRAVAFLAALLHSNDADRSQNSMFYPQVFPREANFSIFSPSAVGE